MIFCLPFVRFCQSDIPHSLDHLVTSNHYILFWTLFLTAFLALKCYYFKVLFVLLRFYLAVLNYLNLKFYGSGFVNYELNRINKTQATYRFDWGLISYDE